MERIGKLTINLESDGSPVLAHEDGQWVCVGFFDNEIRHLQAACALYDSLIPPSDLERSGEMVDVGEVELDEWYWLPDEEIWAKLVNRIGLACHGPVWASFLILSDSGCLENEITQVGVDKVELPRKVEKPRPPKPQKTPMELIEERLTAIEKWQADTDRREKEANEYPE